MIRWKGTHVFDALLARPYTKAPPLALSDISQLYIFEEDFFSLTVADDKFDDVEDAGKSGTDAILDRAGGWMKQFCDGDDNDESYKISHGESWIFDTSKRLWLEARVRLSEANTDDANWIVGLMDAAAADALLDNGGGPAATYDGAVFFKVDGTMQIQFETSNAGTQVTNATLNTFVTATSYKLAFLYDPADGVTAKVTPYVDGVGGTVHDLTISGLLEMELLFGVKAGGANEEAIEIDYLRVIAER